MRHLLTSIMVFILAAMLVQGCATPMTPGGTPQARDPSVLSVGVAADYPPIIYKENGRIVGLEADLARRFADELGRSLRFVEYSWNDLIPALEKGEVDIIMSGMSVTKPREMRISFSRPYLQMGQMALVPRAQSHVFFSPWTVLMHSGKVGVVEGTTGAYLAEQRLIKATVVQSKTPDRAVQNLLRGRTDLFIHDAPMVWWLAARHESDGLVAVDALLTNEYLAWGVRKSDTELLEKANEALLRWYDDKSLSSLAGKWLPYLE